MKSLGNRGIDKAGRIVIPREFLKSFDIKKHDALEVYGEKGTIIIQKLPVHRCAFCSTEEELLPVQIAGKSICKTCFELLEVSKDN